MAVVDIGIANHIHHIAFNRNGICRTGVDVDGGEIGTGISVIVGIGCHPECPVGGGGDNRTVNGNAFTG